MLVQFAALHRVGAPNSTAKNDPVHQALQGQTLESPSKATSVLEQKETRRPYVGSKSVVAYAVSITSCPINTTTVVDGPAILAYSIHQASIRHNATISKYDYKLIAFIHPEAQNCSQFLDKLGYEVQIRDTPVDVSQIQSASYKVTIEEQGCCGSKEFLKLWAFALEEHEIVVHLDTDVMVLQPLDELFDAMLSSNASEHQLPTMFGKPLPPRIEIYYTRDYLQRSIIAKKSSHYGVQGGFFVVRPNQELFQQLVDVVLEGDYERGTGWGKKRYGGFWGAAQIQGFLSYFFGEIRPQGAVELNRCIYNSMIDDDPMYKDTCRTGEETCEDCRERPLDEIKTVHLTTCWKPWHVSTFLSPLFNSEKSFPSQPGLRARKCPTLNKPHPPRCKEVHRAWFDFRQSLERSWGYEVPTEGWWFKRTLGYCTKRNSKKRYYLQLQLPNSTITY